MRRAKVTKATMDSLFSTPPLDYETEFDEVRAGYPNQIGRAQALKYYLADRLEEGAGVAGRIQAAKRNYLAFLKRPDQEWRQPLNLKTFFNNWRDYESAAPTAAKELSREDLIRQHAIEVAAFVAVEGDPDGGTDARNRFEVWSMSFVRAGLIDQHPFDRWDRWKDACAEIGIDPKGRV